MENITINQLLDRFNTLSTDQMTPYLHKIRENLIRLKREHPKGGLRNVDNGNFIIHHINDAKQHFPESEKTVEY